MPTRDENGAKNAERSGDFHPKIEENGKVKEAGEKASKKPYWAKFGRNAEHRTKRELSIFAGSKIKQVKESGS